MNNLVLRSLSGLVYVGAIVGALLYSQHLFIAICMLFAVYGVFEFNRLTGNTASFITVAIDALLSAAIIVTTFCRDNLLDNTLQCCAIVILISLIRMVTQLYLPKEKNPLKSLALSLMSQLYISVPFAIMVHIYYMQSPALLLVMFIMIWLNDSGAYIVGSLLGRKLLPYKMFPRISPKKSWAGFAGGLLFVIAASIVTINCFGDIFKPISLTQMLGYAIVVVAFSTWGDLVESLIKRTLGVKDSGMFLPGHGGILDRIDSLLLVLPATLCYWLLIG